MRIGTLLLLLLAAADAACAAPPASKRIEQVNAAFLRHLAELGPDQAVAVTTVREAWKNTYQNSAPEGFVPDALAVLNADYRAGLDAFDAQRPADVLRIMAPLLAASDPYVAANAAYFHTRALIDLQRYEEAEAALLVAVDDPVLAAAFVAQRDEQVGDRVAVVEAHDARDRAPDVDDGIPAHLAASDDLARRAGQRHRAAVEAVVAPALREQPGRAGGDPFEAVAAVLVGDGLDVAEGAVEVDLAAGEVLGSRFAVVGADPRPGLGHAVLVGHRA